MDQSEHKIKAANFLKYFKKPASLITELMLLIAFTVVAYICLLFFAKYLWVLFTATNVGQTYAAIYEESYRITNDILGRSFISLAVKLTLTSCAICVIAGAILKFIHLLRYFYSDRNFLGRIVFAGLPLTFVVALYMHYTGDISHMDTAYMIAIVPTLCVFSGCFRIVEEFVPTFADVIFIFSRKGETIRSRESEEEVRGTPDESMQKTSAQYGKTVWQTILQDIWKSFEAYITVIILIILIAGIPLIVGQMKNLTRIEAPEQAVTADTTAEPNPVPPKEDNADDRFIAYPGKIVLDTRTRLMWAAEESETLSWHDAKRFCRKYRGGGHRDWRMPTIAELDSLYDSGKQPYCGCVTNLIEMSDNDHCWEWSSETKDSDAAFFAFNLNGKQWLPKSNDSSVHIRPVRVYK